MPLAALTTCGIETIPYYYAPTATSASLTDTSLTFYHNDSNSGSDFKGYDLYYRCYDTYSAAYSDLEAIEALASASSAAPDSVLSSMKSTYKFTRMYNAETGSGTTPLLKFSSDAYKASSVTYILVMGTVPWYVQATFGYDNSTTTTYVYRSAYSTVSSSHHKTFVPRSASPSDSATFDYTNDTADYTGTSSSYYNYTSGESGCSVYLVVFALGMGLPSDSLNLVPSLPASFASVIQIR